MNALVAAIVVVFTVVTSSGTAVHAQFGGAGDAARQGATDAAKDRLMKDAAERAGVPVPGAATSTTTTDADTTTSTTATPDGDAPVEAPEVTGTTLDPGADTHGAPATTLP